MTATGLVDTDRAFREVVEQLLGVCAYALDTEFHRERTYYPKVALVQIAWESGLVLVDPLAVDLTPMREVLTGPGTAVLHASDQDLEVLDLVCGAVPSHLFDTQVAAGFVGMSTPSLGSLYERVLGLRVPKADRLTDWLVRPLSASQLRYAAADVEHLLEVQDRLSSELEGLGRLQWALDECEELRGRARTGRDPQEAWWRIKEARQLKGRAREVVRHVAAWREERAAHLDRPVRHVMSDLTVVGIAQRPPASPEDLRRIRGLEDRHLRGGVARELLDVVAVAVAEPLAPSEEAPTRELSKEYRPAVALASAWIAQQARDLRIDTALLATRADIEAFVRDDADGRLCSGWRARIVGEPLRGIIAGDLALAFGGRGELVLEERSGRPVCTEGVTRQVQPDQGRADP